LFAVTLALLLAATALLVTVALRRFQGTAEEVVPGESLYLEVMRRAVEEHVDPVDAEQAVYSAMKGLVSGLDPHSKVFDPVEWSEFQRESSGEGASTVRTRMLEGGRVAYARITAFRPATAKDFEAAVRSLPLRDVEGFVLDLRFNRGGAFDPAVLVADAWLADGVIVRTKGPVRDDVRNATPEAPLAQVPTVVLVNGSTASAAEIVAGALQDTQHALLVGERTFGKGVVQDVFEFRSWPGGMKLSTARCTTPAGRCLDRGLAERIRGARSGLMPDLVVASSSRADPALEHDHSAESRRDDEPPPADPQLDAALALVRGTPADCALAADRPR
jgi:C-terminal processing protease CtpA/Prc